MNKHKKEKVKMGVDLSWPTHQLTPKIVAHFPYPYVSLQIVAHVPILYAAPFSHAAAHSHAAMLQPPITLPSPLHALTLPRCHIPSFAPLNFCCHLPTLQLTHLRCPLLHSHPSSHT